MRAGPVAYASTGLTPPSSPALLKRDSSARISSPVILSRLSDLSSLPPGSPGGTEAQGGCVDGEGGACAGRRGRRKFRPATATEGICQDLLLPFQRKPGVRGPVQVPALPQPTAVSPLVSRGLQLDVEKRSHEGGCGVQMGKVGELCSWRPTPHTGPTLVSAFLGPCRACVRVCWGTPGHSPGGACASSQAAPPSVQLCWALAAPPCHVPPPAPLPPAGTDTACEVRAGSNRPPPRPTATTATLPGLSRGGPPVRDELHTLPAWQSSSHL